MKLIDNVFSSVISFYKALNDGRHGDEMPLIGAIFIFTLLLTANVLSFFPAKIVTEVKWLYYLVAVVVCSILIMSFYRGKRYLKIAKKFDGEKNKDLYHLITIVYIVSSIVVFAITR